MKTVIALTLLIASLVAAHALGIGKEGLGFGHLGAQQKSISIAPLTPCTSTGIYNLSNVCNDIYFIGALK